VLAGALGSALNGGDLGPRHFPELQRTVERTFERRVREEVERRLAEHPDARAFERRVEERARLLTKRLAEERVAAMREELEVESRAAAADESGPSPTSPPSPGDDRAWPQRGGRH
jgi:hypothetical protein